MSEPVAWAVQGARDWEPPLLFSDEERARKAAWCMDKEPVPLYRDPVLTNAEREAVLELTDDPDFFGLTRTHTKVLRGLLDRLK